MWNPGRTCSIRRISPARLKINAQPCWAAKCLLWKSFRNCGSYTIQTGRRPPPYYATGKKRNPLERHPGRVLVAESIIPKNSPRVGNAMKTAINVLGNAPLSPFSFLSILPLSLLGLLLLVLLLPPFGILIIGSSLPESFTIFSIPMKPGVSSLSWSVWGIVALLIAMTLAPFLWRVSRHAISRDHHSPHRLSLPWWGWLAILWTATAWALAWTRFSWFTPFQPHTFPLLWFGYIVTLNALTYQRSKHCLLLNDPRLLGSLFLLSAGFWWAFEYLNQFVQNWHYVNVPDTSDWENAFFGRVRPALLF